MNEEIKQAIEIYRFSKMALKVLSNADDPRHELFAKSVNSQQAQEMRNIVSELEEKGICEVIKNYEN